MAMDAPALITRSTRGRTLPTLSIPVLFHAGVIAVLPSSVTGQPTDSAGHRAGSDGFCRNTLADGMAHAADCGPVQWSVAIGTPATAK
jgi:hypothetical protein